jgi:Fe-S-cluster containining protein
MTVPKEPIALKEMLPLFFSFADAVVRAAAKGTEEGGKKISCKKGCGACCRQSVPISETEAHWIRRVVDRLPSARQIEIHRRFTEARRRLADAGLLEKLLHPETWVEGEGWKIAMDYFRLGLPCPFLEEESCSIHSDRPIKCREYLVTSPAENCRQPAAESIKMVDLPFQIWTAMARLDNDWGDERKIRWVPLVLALDWADEHPQDPSPRSGQEVLRKFVEIICNKDAHRDRDPTVDILTASGKRDIPDP